MTKQRINRKLSAKIMFEIWSTNFELLFLISETLKFSPLNGKICLNSIPKALTEKFNTNKELFNELKQFIESSSLIENEESCFWTFPEFKNTPKISQSTLPRNLKEMVFPDPKYYMIGFNLEKKKSDLDFSDWEISHNKTDDTLKKSFQIPNSTLEVNDSNGKSWKNETSNNHKSVLQPQQPNKK